MRYCARTIRTGEWLDLDLPLRNVERSRVLSGPSVLNASIEPTLFQQKREDGRRLLDPWDTMIYAVDDDFTSIRGHGIVLPPTSWREAATSIQCAGVSVYPQGYLYNGSTTFGPVGHEDPPESGTLVMDVPPPDTIVTYRQLWAHVQAQGASDLGVQIDGPASSGVRIGSYEDPFIMSIWKGSDVGQAMDTLAAATPFDYVDDVSWLDRDNLVPSHKVRIGQPRLGRARTDLRFADGENIIAPVDLAEPSEFANDVIGLGNGTGSQMVWARTTVDDGRLRRSVVFSDKTVKDRNIMQGMTNDIQRRLASDQLDITSVVIKDHPNARLGSIDPGDDVFIETFIEAFGEVSLWVRVLSITQNEEDTFATLSTQRSASFLYSTTIQLGTADDGE